MAICKGLHSGEGNSCRAWGEHDGDMRRSDLQLATFSSMFGERYGFTISVRRASDWLQTVL